MTQPSDFKPTRFAVVGAGPVGCIVAAFLAKGGYEVSLCDVVPALLAPALDPGIQLEGAEVFRQTVTRTCLSIDDLATYQPEVIFITVKANALPLIASAIEGFYQPGTYVISWQNGIDTELELTKVLGRSGVMRAVVNYGCGLVAPGHVRLPFHHPPHFLQELDPKSKGATVAIARALSDCGLTTEATQDIISMVWRKGVLNACMNPVCAVTGLTMNRAMTDPIVFQTVNALVKECVRVARANEINLGWDFYPHAIEYMSKAGDHKPSMLMDIEAGRRTEVDFINGKFVEYGQRAGIDTPFNRTLLSLVKGLESSIESRKKG
ncbi:MAG: 2-dehydropantoate 2-reductase [Desulfobacterales bacterium]|jgi:2-dehydropantoate 2-reductase|nr:2-dehydropantoate 2-reductase [Desulfobacterales bacterium]